MKKALITGIAGFAGSHLAQHLLEKNIKVYGFYHPAHSTENIAEIKNKVGLIACDVLDKKGVFENIEKISPDYLFHLAAFASPPQSYKDPQATLTNNIVGQLNILEALRSAKLDTRVLIVGSADEYGNIEKKYLPADENTPLTPQSPYAVSKITQDMLGLQYYLSYKMKIIRVRPFNHIGPRQSQAFVVSAFASQIAQLEKNAGGALKVGNLDSERDFTDVRDMVKAYLLALEKGKFGQVYNIGSGKTVKIKYILDKLLSFSKAKITIETDKSRVRTVDIKSVCCDFTKFQKETGWEPKIEINKTLFDTIEYERQKLKN